MRSAILRTPSGDQSNGGTAQTLVCQKGMYLRPRNGRSRREGRGGEGSGGGEKKQLVNDIVQLLFVDKKK